MTTGDAALPVRLSVSAGGVVFRGGDDCPEIVLCGRLYDGLWALPKGTPERGESIEKTARREVREETGLGVDIVGSLGTIAYAFERPAQGVRFEKTVHHFLMRPNGEGRVEDHDHEYDRVEWFVAPEALRLITHRNEAAILRCALELIEAEHVGVQ